MFNAKKDLSLLSKVLIDRRSQLTIIYDALIDGRYYFKKKCYDPVFYFDGSVPGRDPVHGNAVPEHPSVGVDTRDLSRIFQVGKLQNLIFYLSINFRASAGDK